jgi:Mg2+ and Co2+ transporter CorA
MNQQNLGDVNFWLDMANRLGFDHNIYNSDVTPSLDSLSRYFDSSQRGLHRIFSVFDRDGDSFLAKEEVMKGLREQGLFINGNTVEGIKAFNDLLTMISEDKTKQKESFLSLLRNLRLAALLSSSESFYLYVHDYKEDKMTVLAPVEKTTSYLFDPASLNPAMHVKWTHIHDPSKRAILGLATKYGIDPRFTFDILYLWREQARADLVQANQVLFPTEFNQMFIVVPVLRLTPRSEESCRPYEEWRRMKQTGLGRHADPPCVIAEVEHCNLAFLVMGKNVLSFTSDWGRLSKLVTHGDDGKSNNATLRIGGPPTLFRAGSLLESGVLFKEPLSSFQKIMSNLNSSYSHLRTGDAQTLVLKTLCEITEDLLAVSKAYDYSLNVLQKRLDKEKDAMSLNDVKKIRKCLRQLSHLNRLVSPVLAVTDALSNMHWSGDAQLYLSDIRGNVTRFLDDIIAHREFARGMVDQFQNFCESKTSRILYLLTTVTTFFVPGEFLASVYGMNFKNEDGTTAMPELLWEYGYLYFWLLAIFTTGIVLAIIIYLNKRQ